MAEMAEAIFLTTKRDFTETVPIPDFHALIGIRPLRNDVFPCADVFEQAFAGGVDRRYAQARLFRISTRRYRKSRACADRRATPPENACSNTSAHGKTSLRSVRMPIRAWKSGIGTVSVKSRFVVRNMASAISAISLKIRLYTAHCGRKRINHLTLPCWRQQP